MGHRGRSNLEFGLYWVPISKRNKTTGYITDVKKSKNYHTIDLLKIFLDLKTEDFDGGLKIGILE